MGKFEKGNEYAFKKGKSGNPAGRPKGLFRTFDKLSPESRNKVNEALWTALQMGSCAKATEYLDKMQKEDPDRECGIILELCIKGLNSNNGWNIFYQMYCLLFGTPKQQVDNNVSGEVAFKFKFGDE